MSGATQPDMDIVTSLLVQHTNKPPPSRIKAAKNVIQYLKEAKFWGIKFYSLSNTHMSAYLMFPVNPFTLLPLVNVNWGGVNTKDNHTHRILNNLYHSLHDLFRGISYFIMDIYLPTTKDNGSKFGRSRNLRYQQFC